MLLRELKLTYGVSEMQAPDGPIMSPLSAATLVMSRLQQEATEVFLVIPMSVKYQPLGFIEVSRGGLNTCVVEPATVLRHVLMTNAACYYVAHNHPSGNPTPSPDDVELTKRLAAASVVIGLDLVDHIIIGDGRYCSFKELGRL